MPQEFTLQPSPRGRTGKLYDSIPGGIEHVVYTPILTYNGDDTGVTYDTTNNQGNAIKIGRLVLFDMTLTLTAKGTGTGIVDIFGPGFVWAAAGTPCSVHWINMAANFVYVCGVVQAQNDIAYIRLQGATAAAASLGNVTDVHISATTQLRISGTYITTPNAKYPT